jgi:fatty acid desaturase
MSTITNSTSRSVLAHSTWDAVPILAGLAHLGYIAAVFVAFNHLPWWGVVMAGLGYAYLIAWNINSVSHNFIHNPYFVSPGLNRAYSLILSLCMAFSQVMYDWVHTRHHIGNMDRPGPDGTTIDPISIYRYGHDGQPENAWSYTFKSYLRDDPVFIWRAINRKSPADARFALIELGAVLLLLVGALILNWRFVLCMLPFYYLGHSLSSLNGFYEHYRGNPDKPIAWGVSCYDRFYNWLWLNNGYHAEHHFRPRLHWTKMKEFHIQIADRQREARVRVIKWPHYLGFMDRD